MKNFELVFEWIQIGKRRNLLGLEYVHILKRLETRNCTRGGDAIELLRTPMFWQFKDMVYIRIGTALKPFYEVFLYLRRNN